MLKKILMTGAVLLGVSVCAVTAKAQSSRLYFAGYMGLNTPDNQKFNETTTPAYGEIKSDNTFSFAGALGLRVTKNIRLEGELSYHDTDLSSVTFNTGNTSRMGGNISTYLMMVNAYYDFDLQWKNLTPFVTAGLGLAYHDGQISDLSGFATNATGTDLGWAYQVGGGLKYRVKDNLALTGAYRFLGGSDAQIGSYNIGYSAQEIRFGLEYDLPVDFLK